MTDETQESLQAKYDIKWTKENIFLELLRRRNLNDLRKFVEEEKPDVHVQYDVALRLAASDGVLDIVKYLVEEHKADVHEEDDWALAWAAGNGHLEIVKYLVEKGANIHAGGKNPERALMMAIKGRHGDVVKYLMMQGADEMNCEAVKLAWQTCQESDWIFWVLTSWAQSAFSRKEAGVYPYCKKMDKTKE